jgi:hypothetical protein
MVLHFDPEFTGFWSQRSDEGTKLRAKLNSPSTPVSRAVKDIRRAMRRQYSAEEKIRIVLDGLRVCRQHLWDRIEV